MKQCTMMLGTDCRMNRQVKQSITLKLKKFLCLKQLTLKPTL